jgi:hypothetical protein
MFQTSNTILDSCCNPSVLILRENRLKFRDKLLTRLRKRGTQEICLSYTTTDTPDLYPNTMQIEQSGRRGLTIVDQISAISVSKVMEQRKVARSLFEEILRYVAFENRQKFPELKSSELVKRWETITGQKW